MKTLGQSKPSCSQAGHSHTHTHAHHSSAALLGLQKPPEHCAVNLLSRSDKMHIMREDFLRPVSWARRDTGGRPVLPGKSQDIVKILSMLAAQPWAVFLQISPTKGRDVLHWQVSPEPWERGPCLRTSVCTSQGLRRVCHTSWGALVPSEPHQNPTGCLC